MKFLIFETAPPSSTEKRPAPLLSTLSSSTLSASSTHSTSTSSTCSTAQADDDDDWSDYHDDDDTDIDSLDDGYEGRRVRFASPAENVFYENTTLTRDEVRELWYHKADFRAFKQQTLNQAHDLLNSPQNVDVIAALDKAYTGFCRVRTAADILHVLASCPVPGLHNEPHYIGMDRYLVKAIVLDRVERKRSVYRQMTWWQAHRGGDATLTAKLRQLCRTASQPCRLYAHHVAQCALRSETTAHDV